MGDAEGGEISWGVEGRVEADDEADVPGDEVGQDVLEGAGNVCGRNVWETGWKIGVLR